MYLCTVYVISKKSIKAREGETRYPREQNSSGGGYSYLYIPPERSPAHLDNNINIIDTPGRRQRKGMQYRELVLM